METVNEHTHKMAKVNAQVVYIKNISDKDFTHPYAGIPYTLEVGTTRAYPYPIAMHLAKHLAMRIIRAEKTKQGKVGGKDEHGRTINIYSNTDVQATLDKIVQKKIAQDLPAVQTEGERMKQKTEDMQKQFPGETEAPKVDAPEKKEVPKAEIIAELKKRGVKFNAREGKEELLKALIESEKNA
jgi:hypothetical protein